MENKMINSGAKLSKHKILLIIKADFHENLFISLSILMKPKQNQKKNLGMENKIISCGAKLKQILLEQIFMKIRLLV